MVAGMVAAAAGPVVCFGMTEDVDGERANTAVCLGPDGAVLGIHRKVHLPAGEVAWYRAGGGFAAVATPVGRLGLMVDYDKTFPESARCLALDGAEVLVCPSAWPASRTNRAASPRAGPAAPPVRPVRPGSGGREPAVDGVRQPDRPPRRDAVPRPVEGRAA